MSRQPGDRKAVVIRRIAKHWQLYLLLLPALTAVFVFSYMPLWGVQIAFKNMKLGKTIATAQWIGWDNFIRYFNSGWFWRTIKNSLVLGISSQLIFPIPILLAILLHNCVSRPVKKLAQSITYIPNLISVVVTVSILMLFCNGETGFINIIRNNMGMPRVPFFGADKYVLPMYMITTIWQTTGASAIVYLAALSAIDPSLTEAATIDGCSKIKRIRYIDLPAIKPTIIILLILSLGKWFGVQTDKLLLMQTTLNMGAAEGTGTYVYKTGILNAQYGYSTAISLLVNAINFVMLLSANFLARRASDTSLF